MAYCRVQASLLDGSRDRLEVIRSDVDSRAPFGAADARAFVRVPDWRESDHENLMPSTQFARRLLPAVLKRAADVVLATLFLVALAPVILVLTVVLKVTSRGPVFFRQPRIGRGGKVFRLVKFRTMRTDAEERLRRDPALYDEYLANNFKLPGRDPRLTPLGRHLRKFSIDEIPQLVNVVAGHMSLVGPRPVVPDELVLYGDFRPAYEAVRPGVTGAWQVGGRSRVGYPERAMIDYDYVSTWTLAGDFKILLRTIPATVRAHGAC